MMTNRVKLPLSLLTLLVGAVACSDAASAPVAPAAAPRPLLLTGDGASVQSVEVSPSEIVSGRSTAGTVTLSNTDGGLEVVTLTNSDPDVITIPSQLFFSGSLTELGFPVSTVAGSAGCSTVSARVKGSLMSRRTVVYVQPAPTPASSPVTLQLAEPTVAGLAGTTTTGTVRLTLPILSSRNVQLSSSNPDVSVPGGIFVPRSTLTSGLASGSVSFPITVDTTFTVPSCTVITATTQTGAQSRVLLKVTPAD